MTELSPFTYKADDLEHLRAAIYARTSSTSQRFGYSLAEQIRQCGTRCNQLEWSVVRLYQDEAMSGKTTERPMFQQMMTDASLDIFDVVVFWKLDRFSRSLLHAVELEAKFRENDVALYSVTEQLDTTSSAGRFNFRNLASAAEFEREMIGERTQMGLRALALKHKWPNDSPPLGYRKRKDGRLEVHPHEAQIVQEIFEHYLEFQSMAKVARHINARGSRASGRDEWTANKVSKVLKNELYTGQYTVAGLDDYVPEYQIIECSLFGEAQTVRTRFNNTYKSERPRLSRSDKETVIERIVGSYKSYLENSC